MAICIRCDGDARIGAGHVARCLAIAGALRGAGREVVFAGRYEGLAAALLEHETCRPACANSPAGIPAGAEAAIVDLYGLAAQELAAVADARPLVVLSDDGAPTPGMTLDYHAGAGGDGDGLAGPDFAPLDPRHVAARRPRGADEGRVLVALGGGDCGSAITAVVVQSLERHGARALVLTGDAAVATDLPLRRLGRPRGLWDELARADLVVCGAGVSAYEAACAGVPAVLVALADNQLRVTQALSAAGVASALDARGGLDAAELERALRAAPRPSPGPALVDGAGAFRVADALLAGAPPATVLRYRPATPADGPLLLKWRNDPEVRAVSGTTHVIAAGEHRTWLAAVLADPDRELLVAERRGEPVGTVRFDRGGAAAEVSLAVAPGARGGGLGAQMLRETTRLQLAARPALRRVDARVRADNPRSVAAFERAGYARRAAADGWLLLSRAQ